MVKPPDHPETWYTLEQAAAMCERTVRTIENLISLHQLPRQRLWTTKNRMRRRRVRLSPSTVSYLQQITIKGLRAEMVQKPSR